MAFGLRVLLTPRHRAEADLRNKEIGPTEAAFMHEMSPAGGCADSAGRKFKHKAQA